MRHFRVVEICDSMGRVRYRVEEKGWFFWTVWTAVKFMDTYGISTFENFNSKDEAIRNMEALYRKANRKLSPKITTQERVVATTETPEI